MGILDKPDWWLRDAICGKKYEERIYGFLMSDKSSAIICCEVWWDECEPKIYYNKIVKDECGHWSIDRIR